ncbi:MAG: flagellar hook-basal body complex protein [Acetobacteraceae bacterium]|nr:flagellar hook-basal body complex protein [Pseudomonadota bacterium]
MEIVTALAASRLVAQQRVMEVTANNIANANTPGYRSQRIQFSDVINRQTALTRNAPSGDRTIVYTQDRATWRETQAGSLTRTGNSFDLALTSDGYFTVNTNNGPRLTRSGRFGLMPDGTLADSAGNAVLNTSGQPILISPNDTKISIAADGSVSSENGQIGKIGIVRPSDPMKLSAEGTTNFVSNAATAPVATPGIVQGAIEESNVQPVMEVTRMLDDSRQFQLVTQFVQAEADRHQNAIERLLPQGGG